MYSNKSSSCKRNKCKHHRNIKTENLKIPLSVARPPRIPVTTNMKHVQDRELQPKTLRLSFWNPGRGPYPRNTKILSCFVLKFHLVGTFNPS